MPYGCLPLLIFLFFVVLMPLFLADVMLTALGQLGLSSYQSLIAGLGIFLGGMVNIPVQTFETDQRPENPSSLFGIDRFQIGQRQQTNKMVLAVNLGRC